MAQLAISAFACDPRPVTRAAVTSPAPSATPDTPAPEAASAVVVPTSAEATRGSPPATISLGPLQMRIEWSRSGNPSQYRATFGGPEAPTEGWTYPVVLIPSGTLLTARVAAAHDAGGGTQAASPVEGAQDFTASDGTYLMSIEHAGETYLVEVELGADRIALALRTVVPESAPRCPQRTSPVPEYGVMAAGPLELVVSWSEPGDRKPYSVSVEGPMQPTGGWTHRVRVTRKGSRLALAVGDPIAPVGASTDALAPSTGHALVNAPVGAYDLTVTYGGVRYAFQLELSPQRIGLRSSDGGSARVVARPPERVIHLGCRHAGTCGACATFPADPELAATPPVPLEAVIYVPYQLQLPGCIIQLADAADLQPLRARLAERAREIHPQCLHELVITTWTGDGRSLGSP